MTDLGGALLVATVYATMYPSWLLIFPKRPGDSNNAGPPQKKQSDEAFQVRRKDLAICGKQIIRLPTSVAL